MYTHNVYKLCIEVFKHDFDSCILLQFYHIPYDSRHNQYVIYFDLIKNHQG